MKLAAPGKVKVTAKVAALLSETPDEAIRAGVSIRSRTGTSSGRASAIRGRCRWSCW